MRFPPAIRASFAAALGLMSALVPSPATAASGPVAPSFVYPTCGMVLDHTLAADSLTLYAGSGVVQPLPSHGNLASIELRLRQPTYSRASLDVVEWNPLALVPDAGAIALRSRSFEVSALLSGQTKLAFDPPIVNRLVPHLAEPPPAQLAFRWRNTWIIGAPNGPQLVPIDGAADPSLPTGLQSPSPGAAYVPLAGAHPFVAHTLCLGDDALQALVVAQCVRTANRTVGAGATLLQRFRVTTPVRLRWVELSLAVGAIDNGTIQVFDTYGEAAPPLWAAPPLVQADFSQQMYDGPQWRTHVDFDRLITLEPNHDYWLGVITRGGSVLNAKTLDGTQSVDFAAQIGPLYSRLLPEDPWQPVEATALNFRIIGEPIDLTGAPAPPARTLAMRVSPNPARGEVSIGWAGAVGRVRLEVIDARGRRVGGGEVEPTAAGRWTWRAVDSGGGALPAGVYFVRATDAAGHAGAERVVLVH